MAQHNNMNSVFYATTYHPIQAGSIDGTDTASHDNGVYRALVASSTGLYDPTGDPKAEGDPYCTLFVGRLARHTTEKTLHEVMSKCGRVKHLWLVRHIVTGASRGYAFVEFESESDMQNAYEVAQHDIIDGSSILVDYNRQQLMPGWIPRRLGGGLGGRKESGQLRFGGRDRPFRAPLRTIPTEQLTKLGIPLPPVGRYMSRFQFGKLYDGTAAINREVLELPPIPRRPGSSKDGAHHRQKSAYRRSPRHENDRTDTEHRAESSSRLGRRSVERGAERESSTHEEHRSKQRVEHDAKRGYEDEKQHRKRRHSEQDNDSADMEHRAESSSRMERRSVERGGGRESSTHEEHRSRLRVEEDADRGYEFERQHRKRRHSEQDNDRADLEHRAEPSSRMGRRSAERAGEKESSTHEERKSSQRVEEDADRSYEREKKYRKRRHSEQENAHVDHERSSRSSHEDRESSRHQDRGKTATRGLILKDMNIVKNAKRGVILKDMKIGKKTRRVILKDRNIGKKAKKGVILNTWMNKLIMKASPEGLAMETKIAADIMRGLEVGQSTNIDTVGTVILQKASLGTKRDGENRHKSDRGTPSRALQT
ncbi:unnamed protein product [Calypogeia fissa]